MTLNTMCYRINEMDDFSDFGTIKIWSPIFDFSKDISALFGHCGQQSGPKSPFQ